MKVTLAYPWEGHAPDEQVDVEDATGRQLIRDGWARLADSRKARQDKKEERA